MKKNILVFVLDQLSWRALSIYGNNDSRTPNIDSIARNGIAASSCYCSYPLCQPSRASLWSGEYPHRNKVWSNGRNWPIEPLDETYPAIGEVFRNAGYETRHFGKKHDGGALRGFISDEEMEDRIEDENNAFPFNMDTYADAYTVRRAEEYLSSYDGKKPLFAVVDFVNPHNICGWIGKNKGKHDCTLPLDSLPKLPDNFSFDDIENRPLPVQYLCCSHVRQSQTVGWSDDNFREYLAAYYYYLGVADRYVGRVLDALKKSALYDDTLIVFTSDHGDNMTSRGSVTKQATLYEEVTRVPLIFAGPGVRKQEKPIDGICSHLDLFPTLCSYASIAIPDKLDGMDISSLLSDGIIPEHEYVVSEWHTEWGYTVSPGRMLRHGNIKYIRYLEGNGEELYFLDKDPYEKHNAVREDGVALEMMRKLFDKYLDDSNDPFLSLGYKADRMWRSHQLGYQMHRGCSAPEYKG